VPSEPPPDEEEQEEMNEATREQIAADKRNQERDKKCNCSKADCKECMKRFGTGLAFALLINLCTAAFMAVMMLILMQLLDVDGGAKYLMQDILIMYGPSGAVLAPKLYCKLNNSDPEEYRCARYPLGGVAAKCQCNQNINARNLWLALGNQKDTMYKLKPSQFNETWQYDEARANINQTIMACTDGKDIYDIRSYVQLAGSGHNCFLLGFDRVIGWKPEAEISFDVYPAKEALDVLKNRMYTADPLTAIRDWYRVVTSRLHKGDSAAKSIYYANRVFNMHNEPEFELLNKYIEMSEKDFDMACKKHKNGSTDCSGLALRGPYLGPNLNVAAAVANMAHPEDAANYIPVICTATYPSLASQVQLKTYPPNGIYIPAWNVYTSDNPLVTDTVVSIVLPKLLFSALAQVDCVFLARNVDYRNNKGGHLQFHFSYMA